MKLANVGEDSEQLSSVFSCKNVDFHLEIIPKILKPQKN